MKPEILIEHADFVRGLARSLVLDVHSAADIAQQTWVATLEHEPETDRPLRSWLSRVVRNYARKSYRTDRRRKRLERESAIQDAVPPPDEIAKREEMRRRMIDAVLALDEPYRSVILLRYYENLSPREIAERFEMPVGTVKTRLKRALANLRESLDALHDGDRRSWCLVLAPLAGLKPATTTTAAGAVGESMAAAGAGKKLSAEGIAMATKAKIGVAVTVVVLSALVIWQVLPEGERDQSPIIPPALASDGDLISEPSSQFGEDDGDDSFLAMASQPEVVPITPEKRVEEATDAGLAEIVGQFVLPDGEPASGARVLFYRLFKDRVRLVKYGRVYQWEDIELETDHEGRFKVQFDPPPPLAFALKVTYPGYTLEKWRWEHIPSGEKKDLGKVKLTSGGTIAGRVLDGSGQPIKTGFSGRAWPRSTEPRGDRGYPSVETSPDPTTGIFRLENVHPGPCEVNAYFEDTGWLEGPTVEVKGGEVIEVDLQYTGYDRSRFIRVRTKIKHFSRIGLEPEQIKLSGPDIGEMTSTKSAFGYDFIDVPPGSYTIEINDPRILPWKKEGVQPGGGTIDAMLTGNCSLSLRLVDADSGGELRTCSLNTELLEEDFEMGKYPVFLIGQSWPEDGRIEGFLPVDQTLEVRAPGYGIVKKSLVDLKPYEVRELEVRLHRGVAIRGKVIDQEGRSMAGVRVAAMHYVLPVDKDLIDKASKGMVQVYMPEAGEEEIRVSVTDESGSFSIDDVQPGLTMVGVPAPEFFEDTLDFSPAGTLVRIDDDDVEKEVIVRVHRGLFISGIVVDTDNDPVGGSVVFAIPVEGLGGMHGESKGDGRFKIGPLIPGKHVVSIPLGGSSGSAESEKIETDAGDDGVVLQLNKGGKVVGKVVGIPTGEDDDIDYWACNVNASERESAIALVSVSYSLDGSYEIDGLTPGIYDLNATWGDDLIGVQLDVKVEAGETVTCKDIKLEKAGRLTLRLNGNSDELFLCRVEYRGCPILRSGLNRDHPATMSVPPGELRIVLSKGTFKGSGIKWEDIQEKAVVVEAGQHKEIVFDL